MLLQEYDYEICHIPGRINEIADILSRSATVIQYKGHYSGFCCVKVEEVKLDYEEATELKHLKCELNDGSERIIDEGRRLRMNNFVMTNTHSKREMKWKILVPKPSKTFVINILKFRSFWY